jgi:hypothetical protein
MDVLKNVKLRQAAKSISDVDTPDASWKSDVDIVDRYQSFASELMRISLIGIAVYGFVIEKMHSQEESIEAVVPMLTKHIWGADFLSVSLVLILAHRFLSSTCLYYQLLIMRSLKRLENAHWSLEEKNGEEVFLKGVRDAQRVKSRISHVVLMAASVHFALGVITIFHMFSQCLDAMAKAPLPG